MKIWVLALLLCSKNMLIPIYVLAEIFFRIYKIFNTISFLLYAEADDGKGLPG
jgi:hypothetical protein